VVVAVAVVAVEAAVVAVDVGSEHLNPSGARLHPDHKTQGRQEEVATEAADMGT
jgi:hypothetical protein